MVTHIMWRQLMDDRAIAIYARQSVDVRNSVSIETQIEECKTKAKKSFVKIYRDKGYSGKNIERPALKHLLEDIKGGIIKKVIVYRLDRISRNITDFYNLYEEMNKYDCSFCSATEDFDTSTSMGRAMMGMLIVFAQMERENISSRIKDNYDYRTTTKNWIVGKAPYGYKNSKRNGVKIIIPVPEEVEIVKYMFEAYASDDNISLTRIQKELVLRGIHSHQSDIAGLSRSTINRILSNPIYAVADHNLYKYFAQKSAIFIHKECDWDGSCAATYIGSNSRNKGNELKLRLTNISGIVSSQTFIKVQQRLEHNKAPGKSKQPTNNLQELAGFLKCSRCGYAVKMQHPPTITCNGRNLRKVCKVSFKGIRFENIQNDVGRNINDYLRCEQQKLKNIESRKECLRLRIQKLEEQLDLIGKQSYTNTNNKRNIEKKIEKLSKQIDAERIKLKFETDDRDLIELSSIMGNSSFDSESVMDYDQLGTEKRQKVLDVLVDKILLNDDGSIKVLWRK